MTHPVSPDSIDALPQWASHKVIIPDHVLAMGNDLAFELVERMIETRITEQPHIIVRSFERHASLVIIFLTNDAVIGGALAALAVGQADQYFALATDENGSWLPEVSSGDGIRIPKSANSSRSDPSGPQCDQPRASRYRRSPRRIPDSGIDPDV